ncbi:Fic family protein [Lactiplantibacillus pentosus]|jgi:Fic family protein|uniref:Fic family protein n=1 Tax=Lactiplantibacillus pentosus TaxID=1589 RepID=UPI003C2D8B97
MKNLVAELKNERDKQLSGSLYYWTQILFSYNSNHMEGTQLTEDQTQQIFDTGTVFANDGQAIKVDDVLETANHFRAFDYLLDTVEVPVTSAYVFELHRILKRATSQENDAKYHVSGFKIVPNQIGFLDATETTSPADTPQVIADLFSEWEASGQTGRDLSAIAKFHWQFERIHPFSDGNGRIGRLLIFKEGCRSGAVPLIIREDTKPYYLRGLKTFKTIPGYLIDTLGHEQDNYQGMIARFFPEPNHELD